LRKDPKERWESMRALGEALSDWLSARGVGEDISGVPLRALWLGAPPAHAPSRSGRPYAEDRMIRASVPMRAFSEAPVVSNAALFAEVSGGSAPPASRSRYFVMTGLAMLTAALAWKIAFSPVSSPIAAGMGDSAPPAALVTAVAVPLPPPAPTMAPPPPVTVPAAVTTTRPAAPAAPKATASKYVRPTARSPQPPASAAAVPTPAPAPTALLNDSKHTWPTPAATGVEGSVASPPSAPEAVDGR
jgi:eukaryotic-like serine/threonine-protein kinase